VLSLKRQKSLGFNYLCSRRAVVDRCSYVLEITVVLCFVLEVDESFRAVYCHLLFIG